MAEQLAHFVGVDLGQARDFSALTVLERPWVPPGSPPGTRRPPYALRHLQRFALGTPYPQIAESVLRLLQSPPLRGAALVVDQTGVGRAVVEMMADGLRGWVEATLLPIQITGGHAVTIGEDGSVRVPKKELVGAVQVLLQSRRLQIARTLPDARLLVKELENFRVKITEAANETFEAWREGQHDDLVLATALAAWLGERGLPPMYDPQPAPVPPPLYFVP